MMDKSSHSSEEEFTKSSTTRDQYLKHLNKISHRISKPTTRRPPLVHHQPPPAALPLPPPLQNLQPPVYNINKNEFRDVVQKLTGSPAHERSSSSSNSSLSGGNPPPIHAVKPQSSRLQRIRPPPLSAAPPPANFRQVSPPSPLPPFPSAHGTAAESPISAYMRYYQNQGSAAPDSDPIHFSRPLISLTSTAPSHIPIPSSPLPLGGSMSPRSSYPLFSPTAGQVVLPNIPPVPSPQWRDV